MRTVTGGYLIVFGAFVIFRGEQWRLFSFSTFIDSFIDSLIRLLIAYF